MGFGLSAAAIIVSVLFLALGFGIGILLRYKVEREKLKSAEARAREIISEAEAQSRTMKKEAELEAKKFIIDSRAAFEKECREKQKELATLEKRLISREENLERKFDLLESRENKLKNNEQSLSDRRKNIEGLERKYQEALAEVRKTLEKLAGMTAEDAKKRLMESLIEDAKHEAAKKMKEIEDEAQEKATKKAQYIISCAIERMSSEYVSERSISVVHLPNDEMKGRIIGREGRNIRALESATGVDIVIDDTPEAVVISCFDPVRREVARRTLENLIQDGRIHPTRIEDMVEKMTKEVEQVIKETGEQAMYELGLSNIHPELLKLLGSLKFRFSFAQNVFQHSMEAAYIAGMIAAELNLDEKKARRAGLLHDIGKAVSHKVEGSHALVGMEYAKKFREDPEICHSIGAHHEDIPQETALDCIIDAADALSGARPGARREVLETYVKRLEDLERISRSFKGVEKAYAVQAGREIRVMVDNADISDAEAYVLSKDIAKKIEEEMTYPGQIKVTVIRETRAIDYAK